jgi:hypothetical protein
MAGRNEGCASIGCLGFCIVFIVALCRGGGSDAGVDVESPPPVITAPVSLPPADTVVVPALPAPPRELHVGPRGGCYYINPDGSKTYVDRSKCSQTSGPALPPLTSPGSSGGSQRSSGGRQLHVGPRGGCYYINGNGNKTHVDRSECY